MKKFDIKKIGIVLAILVVVIVAIILIAKALTGNVDKESLKKYEQTTIDYYLNLTGGLNTSFDGLEALYEADKTTIENISDRQLLHVAIDYLTKESKASGIDYGTLVLLYKDKYPAIEKSGIFKGEELRDAMKVLFGIENFANPTIYADATALTTYEYVPEADIYLVYGDYTNSVVDPNLMLDYSIVETTSKKDKIITTVAIAYVQKNENKKTYASDRFGENIVAENITEFPTDKIDEFKKYEFTLTKAKDGKSYIFESVKKVK